MQLVVCPITLKDNTVAWITVGLSSINEVLKEMKKCPSKWLKPWFHGHVLKLYPFLGVIGHKTFHFFALYKSLTEGTGNSNSWCKASKITASKNTTFL